MGWESLFPGVRSHDDYLRDNITNQQINSWYEYHDANGQYHPNGAPGTETARRFAEYESARKNFLAEQQRQNAARQAELERLRQARGPTSGPGAKPWWFGVDAPPNPNLTNPGAPQPFEATPRQPNGTRTPLPRPVQPQAGGAGNTLTSAKPATRRGPGQLQPGTMPESARTPLPFKDAEPPPPFNASRRPPTTPRVPREPIGGLIKGPIGGGLGAGVGGAIGGQIALGIAEQAVGELVNKAGTAFGENVLLPAYVAAFGTDWMNPEARKKFCENHPGNAACAAVPKTPPSGAVTGGASDVRVPPFTGGQTPDAPYTISFYRVRNGFPDTIDEVAVYGPISSINIRYTGSSGGLYFGFYDIVAKTTPGGSPGVVSIGQWSTPSQTVRVDSVGRSDGQPDNGGNLPGEPITPSGDSVRDSIANPPSLVPEIPPEVYFPNPITTPNPIKQTPSGIQGAPQAPPAPEGSIPETPKVEDNGKAQLSPTGEPTGETPPTVNENNTLKDATKTGILAGIGAAIATGILNGTAIKDPTKPGQFTAPQGPPAKPPTETPNSTPCPCNTPVLNKLDEVLAGIGTGAVGAGLGLLDILNKIANAVGVSGFPASVPANLAKPGAGTRNLSSLAEMGLWQTEQLDGLVGQFPQKTTVKMPNGQDIDIDQPNISETLAEIMGLLMGNLVTTSEVLNTTSRTLNQAGSATQQAHLAHMYARGNAEFLGYEGRRAAVDMPLSYTPGANPFEGFLNEGTRKVEGWEVTDKEDLKSIMARLLKAAAIIEAVHFREVDTKGDITQQVRQNIRQQGDFVDGQTKRRADGNDWPEYLRQVEQGFVQKTGDNTPYGRDPSESPKIRDLSNPDSSQ